MANKWITHVKQYAAEHRISYAEAMIKAKASYKPIKKLKGGQTVKQFVDDIWYNKIPEMQHLVRCDSDLKRNANQERKEVIFSQTLAMHSNQSLKYLDQL